MDWFLYDIGLRHERVNWTLFKYNIGNNIDCIQQGHPIL